MEILGLSSAHACEKLVHASLSGLVSLPIAPRRHPCLTRPTPPWMEPPIASGLDSVRRKGYAGTIWVIMVLWLTL